jgi:hypothetical protein
MMVMNKLLKKLSDHNFQVHTLAFALMTVPPVFMYLAAVRGASGWIWILVGLVASGNILTFLTK